MENDRHKLKRVYSSGAKKRKIAKEKEKKYSEVVSNTRRMTFFLIPKPVATISSEVSTLKQFSINHNIMLHYVL